MSYTESSREKFKIIRFELFKKRENPTIFQEKVKNELFLKRKLEISREKYF